ncbi:MAG TPA: HEAT repeat domain-containing protein [Thermoanaerobaculia bacterium]
MNWKHTFAVFLIAVIFGGASNVAFAYPSLAAWDEASERDDRESDEYEKGTDAIDDGKWDAAVRHFTRVAEMKGSRTDGALYWTAYALNKLGRRAEALQTIEGLRRAHPQSRWLRDASALEIELRQARGESVSPGSVDDDDLKMIAISSLMHTDSEKAFPILEKIVNGSSSGKIKERALFILSQSSSPRAQALIADMARGKSNPDMQKKAIRYLGMSGSQQNRQALSEMYAAGSPAIKEEVLRAFMISGDKARVLAAAKSEPDSSIRRSAIRTLGIMGAKDDLAAMYAGERSSETREEIITALFLSGDVDKLGQLARGETDLALRKKAIQRLGLMGDKSGTLLQSLYASESNAEVKEAVIHGLFLQGNARALIDLSKKETNRTLRQSAIKKLSVMNNDEALGYLLQVLNE